MLTPLAPQQESPTKIERIVESYSDKASFAIEVLVSAGPRKTTAEYDSDKVALELCEDSAGVLTAGDISAFWVCDGTSNGPSIAGLSNRAFSRDLGRQCSREMIKQLVTGSCELDSCDLGGEYFSSLVKGWRVGVSDFISNFVDAGTEAAFLDSIPQIDHETWRLTWSSTLLIGIFRREQRELTLFNRGDCGAVVLGDKAFVVRPNRDIVALACTIRRQFSGALSASFTWPRIASPPRCELFHNVTGFLAVTDGFSNSPLEEFLEGLVTTIATSPIAEVRSALLRRADPSYDDKAIVFGYFL